MKRILFIAFLFPCVLFGQGRVGINVDTPTVQLDVRPVEADKPSILNVATLNQSHFIRLFSGFSAAPSSSLTWPTGKDFVQGRVNADGTGFDLTMIHTYDGLIGIGTYTPQAKLDIEAVGDSTNILRLGTERPWYMKQYGTGPQTRLVLQSEVNDKAFEILSEDGNRVAHFFTNNGFSRVLLGPDTNGVVGIGTPTPLARLHVRHNSIYRVRNLN